MNTLVSANRKLFMMSAAGALLLLGLVVTYAEAAANDSSITLKKDPSSELFTLTIKDPDGIQEFSLMPPGKLSYGGGLSGCKSSFSSNNVTFADPGDFVPVMSAYVIDCNNKTTELEIHAPVDGLARSTALKKEVPPPPPLPPPPTEEKKDGPFSAEDVQYPVSELGSCGDEAECRSYCDNADRAKECFAFAKKYNLISEGELDKATDKFLNVKNGPGGCNSGTSCEEYCSNIDRLDECITFAEETGYYSPDELAEAKKFQELVKVGTQFPGGCEDRNSCEVYCSDAVHMEECLDFAEESGFMPQEEIDEARKFMVLMQKGESPGGCNSKEQCENFCSEDANIEECISFAEKAGVMTAEEAEMVRKVGGKGPGGCHSKTQCETYCETNSEECFNFAQEHGLIDDNDLQKMKEGMARFRDELDKMPPEAVACMKDAAGEENFNRMVSGEPVFDRSLEGKMKSCFGQITAQFGQQLGGLPPEVAECIKGAIGEEGLQKLQSGEPDENLDFGSLEVCFQELQKSFGGGSNFGAGGFSGPGGCASTGECSQYCQEHPDECQGFGPPGGGGSGGPGGGYSGPGGCTNPEECQAYCEEEEHQDECQQFVPLGGGGGFSGGSVHCGTEENPEECQQLEPPHQGGGGGPGGCTNPEECQAYCMAHPEECNGGGGNGTLIEPLVPALSCVKPPSGLVSWWSADISSGGVVPDINNGRNNGTIVGGVTVVSMEVGNAFQFDGRSGYINIGNPEDLNFGIGPFSLEAWFNWTGEGKGKVVNNIIRKSNYGPGTGSGYWLRIGQDLEFSVGATTQSEGQSIATAPISAGEWHHAVATKDSSGNLQLYVNGELHGTVLRQTKNAESTSRSSFAIGAWPDAGSEFFHGSIDEVTVYNRALNASEVRALFDSGSVGKCSESFGRTNREYQQPSQDFQQSQPSTQGSDSQLPSGSSYEIPTTPELCANFVSVPECSYVGAPDSQNYKLCTQCRTVNVVPSPLRVANDFFANILSTVKSPVR